MRIVIVTPERGAMIACDECGFWPKRLIEVGPAKSPMRMKLCPSCAGKLVAEINLRLPWTGGKK